MDFEFNLICDEQTSTCLIFTSSVFFPFLAIIKTLLYYDGVSHGYHHFGVSAFFHIRPVLSPLLSSHALRFSFSEQPIHRLLLWLFIQTYAVIVCRHDAIACIIQTLIYRNDPDDNNNNRILDVLSEPRGAGIGEHTILNLSNFIVRTDIFISINNASRATAIHLSIRIVL